MYIIIRQGTAHFKQENESIIMMQITIIFTSYFKYLAHLHDTVHGQVSF